MKLMRLASAFIAGSRSRIAASNGVAIKIDEYAPVARPIKRARDKSFNVPAPRSPAPTKRIEPTGSKATMVVLIDRMTVWLIARLAACENGADVAIGSRYVKGGATENWPLDRLIYSKGGSLYTRIITGMPVKDPTAGFICYKRKVLASMQLDHIQFIGFYI